MSEEKKFKELIANISHDLRTPLTAVKGYQQLLEQENLTKEQQINLQVSRKHTEQLGELIDQFFTYSYFLHTRPEMEKERCNLTSLVSECLLSFITALEEKSITVHFDDSKPVFVSADKKMVTRILQNLIRNGMQHGTGDIEAALYEQENYVIISFRNRITYPDELDESKIFDRFYSADKVRNHSSGLGLSIVRLLAEEMDGSASAVKYEDCLEIRVSLPVQAKLR